MKLRPIFRALYDRLKSFVEGVHANWLALAGIMVAIAIGYVSISLSKPGTESVTEAKSTPDTSDTSRTATNTVEAVDPEPPPLPPAADQCSLYQYNLWSQMQSLIDSSIRECVQIFTREIDLHRDCRRTETEYELVLKRQVSGALNDERIMFEAKYAGTDLANPDLSRVEIQSLTPVFARLCQDRRARERAIRRGQ